MPDGVGPTPLRPATGAGVGWQHAGVVDDVLTALAAQHRELAALVGPLDAAGLTTPSACAGWSVADVLLHLSQSDELAVASLAGRLGEVSGGSRWSTAGGDVEDVAADAVAAERTTPEAARDHWVETARALDAALADADLDARVRWVAGTLSARTLATTRLAEAWAHTGDVADGLGVTVAPTGRLWHVCRLVWRTVPYAFARGGHEPAGPVRFVLAAPDGSEWAFGPDDAPTVVTGPAVDLCTVGAQRAGADATALTATGPDGVAVLRLARTFA